MPHFGLPEDRGPWGSGAPPGPPPRGPLDRARRFVGGTLRIVLGWPLLAVCVLGATLTTGVNELAKAIEGDRR